MGRTAPADASPVPPPLAADTARVAALEAELAALRREHGRRWRERTAALTTVGEKHYAELLTRRAAEDALRRSEEKYRGFFEHAVEGTYQSTPAGKYLSVNPALARLYGYPAVAAMQAAVADIARDIYVDPAMRRRFQEMIERDGEVRNLEYQVRRHDGTPIWISENARVARGRRGQVLYYEGTIQDITRRKDAEAEAARLAGQLLQAQKMEAIGTLAGGVAHDFNNILGAIIGYTELAQEDLPAGSPALANLAEVLKAALRAREHVRQILAFSRQSAPERKLVRVGAIVREVLGLIRATVPSTVSLVSELVAANDHAIADASQLHQVIVNLCANASHAMREAGGTLTVRLENATIAVGAPSAVRLPPGPYLRLMVRDTGHGISPEVLPRIFEPFFTTKAVGQGTGLGLSVVHGIVQSHGGEIQVESAPGAGSCFTLWFPAAAPAAAPARLPPPGAAWSLGQGERILVVDDEELLSHLLEQSLTRLGYVPSVHVRSRDALAAFHLNPAAFDLVITDHTMAEMDGLELAAAIRAVRPDLPIILCTGNGERINPVQTHAAGIGRLLFKPMDLAHLSRVIRGVIQPNGAGDSASPWPVS